MIKKTIKDIGVKDKSVLVRVDYNVPLDDEGIIVDDNRIKASLPTLTYLIDHGAKVIVVTHVGRPKGIVEEKLKTDNAAKELSTLLGREVKKVNDCVGPEVKEAVSQMKEGDVLMLENVRFNKQEKENDPDFARELASLADIFVLDGFGVSHRDQTSVTGVTHYLPSVLGLLMEKEVETLTKVRENPEKPLIVVMGGVKLETRIPMIDEFVEKADKILFGGAMIFTFFKAMGKEIGSSLVDENFVDAAKKILEKYPDKLVFPQDVVVALKLEEGVESQIVSIDDIPPDMMGLDVGPKTVDSFYNECRDAKTIIWNGPLGAFEIPPFDKGTKEFAEKIATLSAFTLIGGGDTAAALEKDGLDQKMDFVSTGGGASLTLLEGKSLPGFEALNDA
ncbi:phosphoglycerate kinase [Patescibacteria group bacterium]|nr:phosphoglycerate kinase [Patescibacteria group bacterium]